MRLLLGLVGATLLGGCSGNSNSSEGAATSGAAGMPSETHGGSGGAPGSGGGNANAGSSNAGASGLAGTASGGSAGSQGQGGTVSAGGASGSAGQGGSAGAPTTFTCNQITGMTLTREWFNAGFESDAGIINDRWQLKAREHGYITEWANPGSDFWNQQLDSPCAAGSTNPDHVVLTVLSWNPACCTTQPEWDTQIEAAVTNLVAKYAALKRIDLMTVIRGPGNKNCPTAPAANETISLPAELDAALAASATKHPGLVFVAPKFEGHDCAAFSGGGPHLTTPGNTAVAQDIAAHFDKLQ